VSTQTDQSRRNSFNGRLRKFCAYTDQSCARCGDVIAEHFIYRRRTTVAS